MEPLFVSGALMGDERVSVRCEDGLISAIGVDLAAQEGDRSIDASGKLLTPPMVNGHTHTAMTLFRAFGDDLPLMQWLETMIWPAEAKLTPDDVYWGTKLATVEMLRTGTTRFFDVYWDSDQVARAAVDAGMRVAAGQAVIDQLDPTKAPDLVAESAEYLDRLGELGPLVTPCIAPHAVYTVSEDSLRGLAELMREREAIFNIHLSETEHEVEQCLERTGKRPAEYLDSLGALGPLSILAHGVWLDDAELELVGERGATVVTNPCANMKLAVGGALPYRAAEERGVQMALGTDGPSSNSNLDMFEEAKVFALLQKHESVDPSLAPASDVLSLARGERSSLMGATPLEVGQPADFLLLDTELPVMAAGDLDARLVYGAASGAVDTVVIAGSVVMQDRQVPGAEEALSEVRERAARLTA